MTDWTELDIWRRTLQDQQQLTADDAGRYESAPENRWTCPLYIWAVAPIDENATNGYDIEEQVTLKENLHAKFYRDWIMVEDNQQESMGVLGSQETQTLGYKAK